MVLLLDLTFPLNNAVPQQSKDEAFVFQGSLNAGDYLELEPYAQRIANVVAWQAMRNVCPVQ